VEIWKLGDSEDFVGKCEQFVFDAFGYFEPVERT